MTADLDNRRPESRYARPGMYLRTLVAALGFAWILLYCVDVFIAEPFRYMGYEPRDWEWSEVLVAVLATAALVAFSGSRIATAGAGALVFLGGFVGIPLVWLPVFYGVLDQTQLTSFNVLVAACFGISRAIKAMMPIIRLPRLPDALPVKLILSLVACAGVIFVLLSTGISLDLLSFADVYEQRDEYSSASSPTVAYTVGWVGSGVLPVLAAVGISKRNPPLAIGGISGLLVIYLLTGFKSYILGAAIVFLASWLLSKLSRVSSFVLYGGMAIVVLVTMILDRVTGDIIFTSIAVRRAFSTSGINSAYFYDFFTSNPRYELRHSVLSFLDSAPYHLTPARLIGTRYYDSSETAANANYLADGLANFGAGGMIASAVLVGIWLGLLESVSNRLPLSISLPGVLIVLVSFANTASLTVLATHGGAMVLIALWAIGASSSTGRREAAGLVGSAGS